jgi:hypothetical protein
MNPILKGIFAVYLTINYCFSLCISSGYQLASDFENTLPLSKNESCFSQSNLNLIGFIKSNDNLVQFVIDNFNKSGKKIIGDKVLISTIETIYQNEYSLYFTRIIPSINSLNISFNIFPSHYFW